MYELMNSKSKPVAILLVVLVLAASSLIATAYAQSAIPKPSIPEFTVKYVDNSYDYDVQPSYSIDPYTGKNVTLNIGYTVHTENKSIKVTIKNQPFAPQTDTNGNQIGLYYNVRYKGHYETDWNNSRSFGRGFLASNSIETVLTFGLGYSSYSYDGLMGIPPNSIPDGSQVDFQVEALAGYYNESFVQVYPGHALSPVTAVFTFIGERSGWSETQTVTFSEASTSLSTSPTSLPQTQAPTLTPTSTATVAPTIAPTSSSAATSSPSSLLQTSPESTQQPNLIPYIVVTVAAFIIAFVAGTLVAFRSKKPKNQLISNHSYILFSLENGLFFRESNMPATPMCWAGEDT
jgi:hypothetical protein